MLARLLQDNLSGWIQRGGLPEGARVCCVYFLCWLFGGVRRYVYGVCRDRRWVMPLINVWGNHETVNMPQQFFIRLACCCFLLDGKTVTEEGEVVVLEHLLAFFSGAEVEPPVGFATKPVLLFCEDRLATASTCSLILRLPLAHDNYKDFKTHMTLSLIGNNGFGTVWSSMNSGAFEHQLNLISPSPS